MMTRSSSDGADWQAERREAFELHSAALARRKAAETEEARAQVRQFVADMQANAVPPHELKAQSRQGRTTYRTGITGWYLKRNHSLGVSADGSLYTLDVPPSLTARLRGVHLEPADPPLVVGVGGRDGESIPLAELLHLRLTGGADW